MNYKNKMLWIALAAFLIISITAYQIGKYTGYNRNLK